MTPKEKAKELIEKFKPHSHFWVHDLGRQKDYEIEQLENAKQCTLIAVDEISEATIKYVAIREKVEYSKTGFDNVVHSQYDKFWQEVKQEIEKL
jgi:hypothetical protein